MCRYNNFARQKWSFEKKRYVVLDDSESGIRCEIWDEIMKKDDRVSYWVNDFFECKIENSNLGSFSKF